MHDRKRLICFFLLLSLGTFYAIACFLVYRNQKYVQELKNNRRIRIAMNAGARLALHDNVFFRELAEKAQYYPHDPKRVEALYRLALSKGPSDCDSFASLATYLASRECCSGEISKLWQEGLDRCPADATLNSRAGIYFFLDRQNDRALFYLKRSLELEPEAAGKLYQRLESYGANQMTLISVTPDNSAVIELVRSILRRGGAASPEMKPKLERLGDLNPREHLAVAQIALNSGWNDVARTHASKAFTYGAPRGPALRILAEVAWKQSSYAVAERFSRAAEKAFVAAGDRKLAAETALHMTQLFASMESPEETRKRLLRILEDYPDSRTARRELTGLEKEEKRALRGRADQ